MTKEEYEVLQVDLRQRGKYVKKYLHNAIPRLIARYTRKVMRKTLDALVEGNRFCIPHARRNHERECGIP